MINSHYNFLSTVLCKGIRQSSNQFSNKKQVTIYQFSVINLHLPSIVCYVTRQSFRIFDFRFFRYHYRTQRDDHFANRPSVLNLHFRNANVSTQRVNDLEDSSDAAKIPAIEIQNPLNAKKYRKMLKFKRSNYQKTDQLLGW